MLQNPLDRVLLGFLYDKNNFVVRKKSRLLRLISTFSSDYLLDSRVLSLSTNAKNLKLRFEITFQHSKVSIYRSVKIVPSSYMIIIVLVFMHGQLPSGCYPMEFKPPMSQEPLYQGQQADV